MPDSPYTEGTAEPVGDLCSPKEQSGLSADSRCLCFGPGSRGWTDADIVNPQLTRRTVQADLDDRFAGIAWNGDPFGRLFPAVRVHQPGADDGLANRKAATVEEVDNQSGLLFGFCARSDARLPV